MLFRKFGLPEEGEVVWCTVTQVQHNSVFIKLDEYNIFGLIHISEVSPGRIRNLRDFVKEGKKVVCKILRVNKASQQVDVSLRRVTEVQRRNKVNQIKQEQKAESILEHIAKTLNRDHKQLYIELAKALPDYEGLYPFFMDIVNDAVSIPQLKLDTKVADELVKVVKQRLKPRKVSIKGTLLLASNAPNGVEIIRDAIKKGMDEKVNISYLGAGKFAIEVVAPDYKVAEDVLDKSTNVIIAAMHASDGVGEFSRKK
ncbi:MAG: S1 RNA-binding domain-containing protein [Candidatus Woesearchaeota archaeon]